MSATKFLLKDRKSDKKVIHGSHYSRRFLVPLDMCVYINVLRQKIREDSDIEVSYLQKQRAPKSASKFIPLVKSRFFFNDKDGQNNFFSDGCNMRDKLGKYLFRKSKLN